MKIKQALRYQLKDCKNGMIIFYIVIASIFAITLILNALLQESDTNMSGMEMGSFVFLFVLGLNGFKSSFRLFLQNGLSRKTLLVGFVLNALCISFLMSIIDGLLPLIFSGNLLYTPLYKNLYNKLDLVRIPWCMAAYFASMCCGFFLSSLYYRMNTWLKVLFSVGVPVLFFMVFPIMETFIPSFTLFTSLIKGYSWVLGKEANAWTVGFHTIRSTFSFLGIGVIAMGMSYLLVRRATLKDA